MFYDRPMDDIDRQLVVPPGPRRPGALRRPGASVGLSLSATKRRVDRLVSDGAIRGFTAVVDPQAMGWALSASVELFTTGTVPFDTMRPDLDAHARGRRGLHRLRRRGRDAAGGGLRRPRTWSG